MYMTKVELYVYAFTHTSISVVSPGVGVDHLEAARHLDVLYIGIYTFVHVFKIHLYMYMLRNDKVNRGVGIAILVHTL